MAIRRVALSVLMAWGAIASAGPAEAVIVWNGEEVPAWPKEALPQLPSGAALAASNIGLYPDPKGEVFGLTLLVDFSDTAPAFTKEQIDAWLNQKGYAVDNVKGSVRDYFLDQSNGMVDFQNELFGFYRAKRPKSYYEGTSGYQGSDELWAEIIEYFDPTVDFSKYDNDKDGRNALALLDEQPRQELRPLHLLSRGGPHAVRLARSLRLRQLLHHGELERFEEPGRHQ
jgi:hypothetical protein